MLQNVIFDGMVRSRGNKYNRECFKATFYKNDVGVPVYLAWGEARVLFLIINSFTTGITTNKISNNTSSNATQNHIFRAKKRIRSNPYLKNEIIFKSTSEKYRIVSEKVEILNKSEFIEQDFTLR